MNQRYANATLNRDKKFLIWNFKQELLEKYYEVSKRKGPTVFSLRDFRSARLPGLFPYNQFVLETLRKYERKKGFLHIQGETVTLTKDGLMQSQKLRHDWD